MAETQDIGDGIAGHAKPGALLTATFNNTATFDRTATFDNKFGEQLVRQAPTTPGVYRYLGAGGEVLYVGKAKNIRRRLSNYRNATRKKAHRKMRILVREAHSLVYETCECEAAALLREGELIRTLRPSYNVDGAFAFLYPSLGLGKWDKHTLLCFTTQHEEFAHLDLSWHGSFRRQQRPQLDPLRSGIVIHCAEVAGHEGTRETAG